ncbi:translation initiation factor eIF-2B subunit alpha [Borealophlyctis nickersoniae]|nr:translation initiation factor eIF-2B subunit alpha [Borealophlyctis nickersoniae]
MASGSSDWDIKKCVRVIVKENPDMSLPVVAVKALLEMVKHSKAATISEFMENLQIASQALKNSDSNKISMIAGADLFVTYVTRLTGDTTVFEDWQRRIIENVGGLVTDFGQHREKAAEKGMRFINDEDVILIHSYSRVVMKMLLRAKAKNKRFRVFVTESRPSMSGEKAVKELQEAGIPAELILDSSVGYIIHRVDMVIVGAEGVVQNGGIINHVGTYQIAVVAKATGKPFYVVAESYKFVRIFPLQQDDLPIPAPTYFCTESNSAVSPIHPSIDYTPPQYITMLFTNLGVLTPSGVSEELIKYSM